MVDTNVWLGTHPWRHFAESGAAELVKRLDSLGIAEAWVGSFESWLHRDLDGANARLAETCAAAGTGEGFLLRAFGTVNPTRSGWRETLGRCARVHRMPGIRLLPGPHGYGLEHAAAAECLALARTAGLMVQIMVRHEDPRTQLAVDWPDVPLAPLVPLLTSPPPGQGPPLRLQLLNALNATRDQLLLKRLAEGGARFDHAMLEGLEGVGHFEAAVPGVLTFGSYAPFFTPESAVLKLKESVITDSVLAALTHERARALLP